MKNYHSHADIDGYINVRTIDNIVKVDRRGGARKNAGRDKIPAEEKKVQIAFYVRKKNAVKLREEIKAMLKALDK